MSTETPTRPTEVTTPGRRSPLLWILAVAVALARCSWVLPGASSLWEGQVAPLAPAATTAEFGPCSNPVLGHTMTMEGGVLDRMHIPRVNRPDEVGPHFLGGQKPSGWFEGWAGGYSSAIKRPKPGDC